MPSVRRTKPLSQAVSQSLRHTLTHLKTHARCAMSALGLALLGTTITSHAATNPADPNKVIHVIFSAPDDGFDLVHSSNYNSGVIGSAINETLLTYDYLARPAKLVPNTATAMPEVSDGGKVYVFHLKQGILFAPDAAFKGKPRELTAADYAYTLKRFLDPKNRSPSAGFLMGKIVGLDEQAAKAKSSGKFDYDAPIAGLETPDRYTLKITLKQPDYNFLYVIAYSGFGAVAREVIEAYGSNSGQHPVGTGAYMLEKYVPRSKIVLTANPNYRGFVWDFKSTGDPWDAHVIQEMQGKHMPQVGKVMVDYIDEEQSMWLAFKSKQVDYEGMPQLVAPMVLDGDKLKPEYTAQGIRLYRQSDPEVTYTLLNYKDPVIGGTSLEKVALRRAIIMAYSVREEIDKVRKGQAKKREGIIPEGVAGYDPSYVSSVRYDPDLANKLLDHFGYKRGADGFRTLPDGKPLVIKITTESGSTSTVMSEIWKRGLDQIGIHAEFPVSNFADNLKAANQCKLQMWGGAWIADFPEGENFMQLMYGPNAGGGNNSCYTSKAYDALYDKARSIPPGPERMQLYNQMNRQFEADGVWSMGVSRIRNVMLRPWVLGYKAHPFILANWQYLDIAPH